MPDLTVPVPDDRVADFFQFFGRWLDGSLSLSQSLSGAIGAPSEGLQGAPPDRIPWGNAEQDFADAEALWRKYSPRARIVFSLLMDSPDKEYTGQEIAEATNIPNGAHGVAGVMAWPGRYGHAIGRPLPAEWREDKETLESFYWMPAATAEVFKVARARVEGAD